MSGALETARLVLRPWREEDADALFRLSSDPEVGPRCGWEPHTSPEESRRIIREVLKVPETYAVVRREDGALMGSIGLKTPEEIFPELPAVTQRELGYWLGRPYWGRGFMPEAVRALLERAFGALGCQAVWCAHYVWNDQSRRVIEKCGFRYQLTRQTTNLLGIVNETRFYAITRQQLEGAVE